MHNAHSTRKDTDVNETWNGSTVVVYTTDKNYSGKLIGSDATGIVIEIENSTPADAPFDSLSEETTIELFIPIYRIVSCARGRFTGIS